MVDANFLRFILNEIIDNFYSIIVTALICLILRCLKQYIVLWTFYPPGPTPLPFIGNLSLFDQAYPHETFLKLVKRFGPVFTVNLANPIVVIADYAVLKQVNTVHGKNLAGRPSGFLYGLFSGHKINGDGIILCQGERWSAQRRFALKTFRNFGMGKSIMENKINHHVKMLLMRMALVSERNLLGAIDLSHHISFCVGGIINDLVIGRHYNYGDPEFLRFKTLIDNTLEGFASPSLHFVDAFPWLRMFVPYFFQYKTEGYAIQKFFIEEIARHEQTFDVKDDPTNFIDAYLKEMHEKGNEHFSHKSLAMDSGDLWTGGMETTVTTIRWGILYMMHYPDVQKKIHAEIDAIISHNPVKVSDKQFMPYVQATLDELLRITNVLPWGIPHQALADIEIEGHKICAGSTVMIQVGAIHFDPKNFPDPNVFNPRRFLNHNGQYVPSKKLNPFGLGKRQCLGESLARMELFLMFVSMLQNFSFHPVCDVLPSLKRRPGMTCVPYPYYCQLRQRNQHLVVAED